MANSTLEVPRGGFADKIQKFWKANSHVAALFISVLLLWAIGYIIFGEETVGFESQLFRLAVRIIFHLSLYIYLFLYVYICLILDLKNNEYWNNYIHIILGTFHIGKNSGCSGIIRQSSTFSRDAPDGHLIEKHRLHRNIWWLRSFHGDSTTVSSG